MNAINTFDEIIRFAKEGLVWPTGRAFVASEWTDSSEVSSREGDWRNAVPLAADWMPDLDHETVIHSDQLAELIHRLNVENGDAGLSRHHGLAIERATIVGLLDYVGGRSIIPLRFKNCYFQDGLNFKDSHIRLLTLRQCKVKFLSLKRAEVDRSVVIEHSMVTDGLNMRAADIGGVVGLKRSRLFDGAPDYRALDLRNARIGSSLFLRNGFFSNGFIDLSNVRIDGNLDCGKGKFHTGKLTARPIALRAKHAQIQGSAYLNREFEAKGEVDFRRATIGAQMTLTSAVLNDGAKGLKQEKRPYFALNLENATIEQDFKFLNLASLDGDVGLHNTSATTLNDDPQEWVKRKKDLNGKLWLMGFDYGSVTLSKSKTKIRTKWFNHILPQHYVKNHFIRQPWEQMASVLNASGDYEAADELYVEAESRSLRHRLLKDAKRFSIWAPPLFFYYLFMRFIRFGHGFGYVRIIGILFFFWVLNTFIFGLTASEGRMKPSEEEVVIYMEEKDIRKTPDYYVQFNSIIYSLDVILPVDLGQQQKWIPMNARETPLLYEVKDYPARFLSKQTWLKNVATIKPGLFPYFPKWWSWLNICFGWLGLILIGASFAGNFSRNRKSATN